MKKYFYGNIDKQNPYPIDTYGHTYLDNERRKLLSIETNRRRRDMAIRVKLQIQKEDERRNAILHERREYHKHMSNKMRKTIYGPTQSTPLDLDQTFSLMNNNSHKPMIHFETDRDHRNFPAKITPEDAWTDSRERCSSPMAKYSGANNCNKLRTSDFYLKTFETKLMAQEKSFKQKQDMEMTEFERILDETIEEIKRVDNNTSHRDTEQNSTFRIDSGSKNNNYSNQPSSHSETNYEEVIEDSLDDDSDGNIELMEDSNKELRPSPCDNNANKQNALRTTLSHQVLGTEVKEYNKGIPMPRNIHSTTNQNIVSNVLSSMVLTTEKENSNEILLLGTYPNTKNAIAVSNMVPTTEMNDYNKIVVSTAAFHSITKENISTNVLSNLVPTNYLSKDNLSLHPIKSILKKDMNSKFNSNPDLSGITLRDSVEVSRNKSARMRRSNSFSQGINYIANKPKSDERNYVDDESGRKIVRFADDPQANKTENIVPINTGIKDSHLEQKIPDNLKSQTNSTNPKIQKPPLVPNSTPLKPPLHPRTIQEGSYLQATFKKTPIFQPPAKPKKINADTLDHEIGILSQKKPVKNPSGLPNASDVNQHGSCPISLDKTPTEREIDQLWAEVRECLSRTQNLPKTGSVGTPAGISVRTIDSGSESSVRSAPAWQRNIKKVAPFKVRHHGAITSKQNVYQGQELPVKDLVIVHGPQEPHIHPGVIHHPLSVLRRQDQGFQQVSESLEEFLATENACHAYQSPRNVFLPHPPPALNRPKFRPPLKYKAHVPSGPSPIQELQFSSNVQKTQLSMDEEQIKISLDRLNERLKNVTNLL